MGIYREVETIVMCDKCGTEIKHWISTNTGVSKEWATYYARLEGATVGKRGVICKKCRIEERQKKCSLIKRLGEPGKEADGTCRAFVTEYSDEPIEQCKRCVACTDFDWEEERKVFEMQLELRR